MIKLTICPHRFRQRNRPNRRQTTNHVMQAEFIHAYIPGPNDLIIILDDIIKMETFSALLALCVGYSPVNGIFLAQRPVTRRFEFFFDLRLNQRLSKQSWGWWFERPSCPLWRHCNAAVSRQRAFSIYENHRYCSIFIWLVVKMFSWNCRNHSTKYIKLIDITYGWRWIGNAT